MSGFSRSVPRRGEGGEGEALAHPSPRTSHPSLSVPRRGEVSEGEAAAQPLPLNPQPFPA
jgi:hypothetical protein